MLPSALLTVTLIALALLTLWRLPPLHPAQLWAIPWAIASSLYLTSLLPYRQLSWLTVGLAAGASAAFIIGTVVGSQLSRTVGWPARERDVSAPVLRAAAIAAVVLAALLVAAFLAQVSAAYGVRAALVSSPEVRRAVGAGTFSVTIKFVYAALAASVLSAMAAADSKGREARVWGFVTFASCASLYFSTGRSTVLIGVLAALVAYALYSGHRLSVQRFVFGSLAVGVVSLGVFMAGGQLIGKTFENNPSLRDLPSVFRDHPPISELALPYQYASAPIAALDVQVDASGVWGSTHGCAAFVEICRFVSSLGPELPQPPRIRPFTAEPLPWNTYTALDVPLLDVGMALAIPFVGLLGVVIGAFWELARRRLFLGVSAYALLAPAIITASGQFNFTAPHLLGATLIVLLLVFGMGFGRMRSPARLLRYEAGRSSPGSR